MTDTKARAAAPARPRAVLTAVLWMMGALVSFTLIAIAGRQAAKGVDTFQLMFWRSLVGTVVMLAMVPITGSRFTDLATPRMPLHVLRAAIHWGGQFSWLYALTRMPLAELFALEFTSPLWVAMLAPFLLGEKLSLARISAAGLGFLGVLLVVRPGTVPIGDGTIFGLACAIGFGLSMICTKRLIVTDSAFKILFWMQVIQMLIGVLPMLRGFVVPDAVTFFWIAMVGILGLTAHYSLAQAFRHADAIIVAPMDFLRLPLIAVVGVVLYKETLNPWVLAGGLLVVAANLLNIRAESRARPA